VNSQNEEPTAQSDSVLPSRDTLQRRGFDQSSFRNPAYSKDELNNNTGMVGTMANVTVIDQSPKPVRLTIPEEPTRSSSVSSSSSSDGHKDFSSSKRLSVKDRLESMGAVPMPVMAQPESLENKVFETQNDESESSTKNTQPAAAPGFNVLKQVNSNEKETPNQILVCTESSDSEDSTVEKKEFSQVKSSMPDLDQLPESRRNTVMSESTATRQSVKNVKAPFRNCL